MKIVALLFALGTAICSAQQVPANRPWDISIWAAGATGEENTNSFAEAQIFSAGVLIGKMVTPEIGDGWRRGRLELAADVFPAFLQLSPQRIHGVGFDPVILRWHPRLHRSGLGPFFELGGGGLWTNTNFPAGDTSTFNFIARGGAGILIHTKETQAFEIGCRWWHISNANLGVRNPEFNGIQVNVGWHWFK
jgi:hypothetical protein